jgi:uncharacterized protein (TIGR02646 family)
MRKFTRLPEPEFLAANWIEWGLAWKERQTAGGTFYWHQVDGQPVNQKLLPALKEQTQEHCSFCDAFPVSPPSDDTVEHFRPKAHFPEEAYHWPNLYYCCRFCQGKSDNYDEASPPLQPDAVDYSFDRYFRWDYTLGTLEVNERATEQDQKRARTTIDQYRLNEEHPTHRKTFLRWRRSLQNEPLDDFPYRDYLETQPSHGPAQA